MRISAKRVEVIATPLTDDEWTIIGAAAALIVAIAKASN